MTTNTRWIAASFLLVAGVAWAAGDWSDTKRKTDDAKRSGDEVKQLVASETKKVVAAMCETSDDDPKSAGERAASSARDHVRSKLDTFHRLSKDALALLEHPPKDHDSEARSLASDLKSQQSRVDDSTRELADGRPAAISTIAHGFESARHDRLGSCTSKDFSLDGNKIACLKKSSDTCYAIELAPDSSSATSRARDRARRAKEAIEHEIKRDHPSSYVSGCKKIESRVDCFKRCPDVDSDGKLRERSASWREGC